MDKAFFLLLSPTDHFVPQLNVANREEREGNGHLFCAYYVSDTAIGAMQIFKELVFHIIPVKYYELHFIDEINNRLKYLIKLLPL